MIGDQEEAWTVPRLFHVSSSRKLVAWTEFTMPVS
jgi:hypothetical protein